jgi:hypothetical protein
MTDFHPTGLSLRQIVALSYEIAVWFSNAAYGAHGKMRRKKGRCLSALSDVRFWSRSEEWSLLRGEPYHNIDFNIHRCIL